MQLKHVTVVRIPKGIVDTTIETLRAFGRDGCEGLVLWMGTTAGCEARIELAWIPPQTPIRDETGVGYLVSGDAMLEISRECQRRQVGLIAQVHSHPGEAYHSAADDRYAVVTTNGGYSLVVPNFGAVVAHIPSWANYRLNGREWVELTPKESAKTFIVELPRTSFGSGSTSVYA